MSTNHLNKGFVEQRKKKGWKICSKCEQLSIMPGINYCTGYAWLKRGQIVSVCIPCVRTQTGDATLEEERTVKEIWNTYKTKN